MCCESFWKGVVVFSLTFGLSVFVSGFFIAKELPSQVCPMTERELPNVENDPVSEAKNCVPVDGNLKYERLTAIEDTRSLEQKKQEDKKKTSKDSEKKTTNPAEAQPQFYEPSKDSAEYKTLLHKEKCYESDGRK